MGVVSFSTTARVDQSLTDSEGEVNRAINAVLAPLPTTGGLTNLDEAIATAADQLVTANARSKGSNPKVMLLITDGQATAARCSSTSHCDIDAAAMDAATRLGSGLCGRDPPLGRSAISKKRGRVRDARAWIDLTVFGVPSARER